MKNKTLKNLIATGIFVVSIFSVHSAFASSMYYNGPSYNGYDTSYYGDSGLTTRQQIIDQQYAYQQRQLQLESQISQQQYYNDQQKLIQEQNLAIQKQNLANVNSQPTVNTVNYVPQQTVVSYVPKQTITYVPASAQGATVYKSVATNKVVNTNSGQYVNYDPNLQAANAYGYGNGQVVSQAYDPNGVTALSMNGSGGFLPTSVFQWFMLILLILAIIIVARIIIKKKAHTADPHAAPAH